MSTQLLETYKLYLRDIETSLESAAFNYQFERRNLNLVEQKLLLTLSEANNLRYEISECLNAIRGANGNQTQDANLS